MLYGKVDKNLTEIIGDAGARGTGGNQDEFVDKTCRLFVGQTDGRRASHTVTG